MATICTRIAILFETNSWKLYTFGLRHYKSITAVNHIHHDNIRRRISPEYLKDFSVSSRQWFFSTLVQLQKTQITQTSEFLRYPNKKTYKRVEKKYLSYFVQLVPHMLQQLGKVAIPFIEFQLLSVQYLLRYLNQRKKNKK